jgi:hypothetical protein
MRINVYEFIRLISEVHQVEPIVEYGSKVLSDTHPSIRDLFPDKNYTGCDLEEGRNVDIVENLLVTSRKSNSVGTLLVCETLEHVFNIEHAFTVLKGLLSEEGLLVITLPGLNFPIHHLPDYWRLTPQALSEFLKPFEDHKVLFQGYHNLPHTLFGIAGNKKVIKGVMEHFKTNIARIPGSHNKERIWLWDNPKTFGATSISLLDEDRARVRTDDLNRTVTRDKGYLVTLY